MKLLETAQEPAAATLDDRAIEASASLAAVDALINEFRPFLGAVVRRFCDGANAQRRDEMFSVAMTAFYEAIKVYNADKGHFLPFAGGVVRRRLIDLLRQEYRNGRVILLRGNEDDESEINTAMDEASMEAYGDFSHQELLRMEIEQFTAELKTWEITFDDLVKQSPRHKALQRDLRNAVVLAAADDEIMQTLLLKRHLPVKKIALLSQVPEKKLERARKFILASILIRAGDYECLSEYVKL